MILEGPYRRKDGTTLPAEINIRYVTVNGQDYFVAVARDITERRRSEQRLRESEERLRLITETIQEVFWIADADLGRTHYVSPAYEKLWGRPCQELLAHPRSFLDAVHPDDRERIVTFFENRPKPLPYSLEYRIVRPDGSLRWILDRGFPTQEGAASHPGFVGVALDITERKQSEVKVRESEERYRKLFETCDDGVFILELSGRILSANPGASRLHGYSIAELLTVHVQELTVPSYSEETAQRLKRIANGETLRFQVVHRRKDGTSFFEEVVATPMRIGSETFVLSFERDVTEAMRSREHEKVLRDELSHAARLGTMGEMASGIAHELNQPLGALALYAETARRLGGKTASPELQTVLQNIAEQSLRAGEILRRMRAFVKRVPPCRTPVDLNGLVREVLTLLEYDLQIDGVQLHLDFDGLLPPVLAETVQIQQVIVNLVRNVIEAMQAKAPNERALTIRTKGTSAGVKVSVIDTGCGIPPAVAARLFEPFQTTKPTGLGIGLSICQKLIASHGGSISCRPNPLGGTIFEFVLPVAEETVVR